MDHLSGRHRQRRSGSGRRPTFRPRAEELETRVVPSLFLAAQNFATDTEPLSVAVGDFNGDGRPDLAVANFGSNSVSVLLGNGNGTFQAAQNFTTGSNPASVAVGDFNGDGRLDLAVANDSSET